MNAPLKSDKDVRALMAALHAAPGTSKKPQDEDIHHLKTIQTKDQAGRTITTFEGSPMAWMRDFATPPRRVTSIRMRSHG